MIGKLNNSARQTILQTILQHNLGSRTRTPGNEKVDQTAKRVKSEQIVNLRLVTKYI